jgi:hypothetical protein
MYSVALAGLRLAPWHTLSRWTAIDVAAAVALGAIIGRTAIAGDHSLAVGAAALVAILVANFYESKGELTIVPERGPQEPDPDLVRIALSQASSSLGHPAGPPSGPGT